MKSAEFLELDEGIASYAKWKLSDLKGKAAGMFRTPAEKAQAAAEKSSANAKDLGSTAFKTKLKTALKSAISSGAVSVAAVPESYSYDSLNKLVENQIISEAPAATAATVEQWMTRYMAALTKNYVLTPEDKTRLAVLIAEFSTGVTGPDSFPEPVVDKLWDHVWQIGSSQERDERGKLVKPTAEPAGTSEVDQYGPPKTNDTLDYRGNVYTYDQAKDEWSSTRGLVQKPESIQALNKAYHDKPKTAAASTFDKYGLPKVNATLDIKGNEYYYTIADKKWRDEAGVEISKPEDIQTLNKTWYDKPPRPPRPPRPPIPPRPRPISP